MKRGLSLLLALALLLPTLAGCSALPTPNVVVQLQVQNTPTPSPSPTPTKPSPYDTMASYLKAWEQGRYGDMYDLLSAQSQASIARDKFVQRYQAITEGSTILSVKTSFTRDEKLASAEASASLPFGVVIATGRVGEIREDNVLPLVLEGDRWKVNWSPSLIFKDLTGDNRILFESADPQRGSVLDRKGRPLATTGKITSLGVVPGQIKDEAKLLVALQQEANISSDRAKQAYQGAPANWFIPLRDLSSAQAASLRPKLESIPGIMLQDKPARVYPNGSVAAQVIGYLGKVTAEELKARAAKGYTEDDLVGRDGIEAWAEDTLAGEKGGKLSVVTQQGQAVKVIAQKPAKNGQDVQLTLDVDLQKLAEDSLGAQAGSAVILNEQDDSILALASYPRFDPNQFVIGLSDADYKKLSEDPLRPFQNRPVSSTYPTGSVFKVVTMSAGMEKGGFTRTSPFDCNGQWTGLGNGIVLHDWLPQGHGHLDLYQGLVQSCDIVFYEVGKKLDSVDPNVLPTFARGFGFGRPTGLVGLPEASGLVPDPAWKRANRNDNWYLGDTINLAIGQGFFLATPLQVANAYAALGRGGDLLMPVLVAKQGDQSFQAKSIGSLPVSAANQDVIRQAMRAVTSDPNGTAAYAFRGSKLSVAAKTGSAETGAPPTPQGSDDTHAWFAGFAPADKPQIALVVMVEGKGHGGEIAAPVARKILDGAFR